jgi:Xaa-Pro aminopeptidase
VNYGPNCASAATLFGCDRTQNEIGSQSPTWICFPEGWRIVAAIRPIISRLVSLDRPMEIKTGMVFALETYCPATDGYSAARIEEEVVVTDTGCTVISLFPAEELPIANRY